MNHASWELLCASARWSTLTLAIVAAGAAAGACDDSGSAAGEGREPGQCEDGADNDSDGSFDCDDTDCAGAPACGGGSGGESDDASDSGPCVTEDDVVVAGSYDARPTGSNVQDCQALIGGSQLVCQVSQAQCSATTSCNVMGVPVDLTGDLKFRGGDNAHGYDGSTVVAGFMVDYDVEFRCASDPTCGYLDFAVVSIIVPANGLSCVFSGTLI